MDMVTSRAKLRMDGFLQWGQKPPGGLELDPDVLALAKHDDPVGVSGPGHLLAVDLGEVLCDQLDRVALDVALLGDAHLRYLGVS
jgi:hypothetical protein